MKRNIHNQLILFLTILFTVSACDVMQNNNMFCMSFTTVNVKVEEIKPFPTFQVEKDQNKTITVSDYIKVLGKDENPECDDGTFHEVKLFLLDLTVADTLILSARGGYDSIHMTGINKGTTSIHFTVHLRDSNPEYVLNVEVSEN